MTFTLFTGHGAIPINPENNRYLLIQHIRRLLNSYPLSIAKLQTDGKVKHYWIKNSCYPYHGCLCGSFFVLNLGLAVDFAYTI
jgi:hypothetical protein